MNQQGNTKHRAAVITPREIAYGNGTTVPAREGIGTDLARILNGTPERFTEHSTVVVDGVAPAIVKAQTDALKAAGWKHSQIDAWTLFHRDDGRTVAMGFRDAMSSVHLGVLFDRDTDPVTLATLLDRYHQATGHAWRGTCATTALSAIRLTWGNPQYQPLWNLPKIPVRSSVGPISQWSRPLNEGESGCGYVHTFDATAAYLGSAISADLAWSQLHHTGSQPFDHTLPGYWLLELDTATLEALRDPGRRLCWAKYETPKSG